MGKALYAGSFDPLTKGHLWMIKEGAKMFEHLVVGVAENPDKKTSFTLDQRVDMLIRATSNIENISVQNFRTTYTADYANTIGANILLRGIRSANDFVYEEAIADVNHDINSHLTSIFLIPPPELKKLSSSLVKGLIGPEKWEDVVERYVPRNVYNQLLIKHRGLERRFNALWKRLAPGQNGTKIYEQILQKYSEPHRAYHVLTHIAYSLREFDTIKHLLDDPDITEFSLFMHDYDYNTNIHTNEADSARAATNFLAKAKVNSRRSNNARKIIQYTDHKEKPEMHDALYGVDCDMSILGKLEDEFDEYERDVRFEYSQYSDEAFRKGRSNFLKETLKKDEIFYTPEFKEKYEAQARKNLNRSINQLS